MSFQKMIARRIKIKLQKKTQCYSAAAVCVIVYWKTYEKNQCKSAQAKIRQKNSTIFTATTATAISWPTKSSQNPV